MFISLKKIKVHIIHKINVSHSYLKKLDILTINCVIAGNSTFAFVKVSVIFGTINIIINVTTHIVKVTSINGYIRAHLTFHFNSMLSSRFASSSLSILHNCHVFSQTHISAVIRESNILGYCCIVSAIVIQ